MLNTINAGLRFLLGLSITLQSLSVDASKAFIASRLDYSSYILYDSCHNFDICSTDNWGGVAAGSGRSDRETATPKSDSSSTSRLMKCFVKFFHSFVKPQRAEKPRKFLGTVYQR